MNSQEKDALKKELKPLDHYILRDICEVLFEDPSSKKPTMIKRISNSVFEYDEIIDITNQIIFANYIEEFIDGEFLRNICERDDFLISGNKHELLIRIIEYDFLKPVDLLKKLTLPNLNRMYERIFDRTPRMGQ